MFHASQHELQGLKTKITYRLLKEIILGWNISRQVVASQMNTKEVNSLHAMGALG